jgi:hypothetical protein
LADARVAAEQAEVHLNACDNDTRLELVKALVEIQIHLGQEETAERLVRGELQLHPEHPELRALLARIAFIQGDWFATNEAIEAIFETIQLEGATDQNLAWLQTMSAQSFIKKNHAFPDSIQNELLVALAPLPLEQRIKHREDVLKILKSESSLVLDALEWARSLRAIIPRDHREEYALASLEVARCAQRTGSQSIAILHFHDAKEGAELSGNKWLLAEVLRQQAAYQAGRNDTEQAIESYRALDSVNLAIASSYANQNNRPIKRFTIGTLNEPDPFDQALQLGADSHAAQQTGAWPWVVALLALGLLTLALHNREMRRSLRTERSRIIRLRSLIPVGRLPVQDKPHTRLSDSEIDGGAHWAFHPGLTDESHPEYQHIANQTTVNETSTQHYDLGATQILDNGTRDDLRNRLTTANAEEIDFAIADLLDCNIVARWGLRTATAAPTSQNLNTYDAYYIEREDEVPPPAEADRDEERPR